MSSLSLSDGILFSSHKKKVEKMKTEWDSYPFSDFVLKAKGKKSFVFVRTRAECQCGRKSNLKCTFLMCSKCCKKHSGECKIH